MAITFTREAFGRLSQPHPDRNPDLLWVPNRAHGELPRTEFYGEDGWILGMPERFKAVLPIELKLRLQLYPARWRVWDERRWRLEAELLPGQFAHARELKRIMGLGDVKPEERAKLLLAAKALLVRKPLPVLGNVHVAHPRMPERARRFAKAV